jgi:four helix bundle protein
VKVRVKDVTQLEVFKIAHELALDIYKVTSKFPKEELYNLVSQLRKASSSICANLMEGSYRNSSKEFKQFCGIARGSAGELKYFLMLSKDLGYIENKKAEELINKTNQITKMLYRLIKSLERKNAKK